jgi:hypothetical protein
MALIVLVPDQVPQECTGGPRSRLLCCKTRQKLASSRETREFFKKTSFWRVFGARASFWEKGEFLEKLGKNSRVDGKNSPILNFLTGRGFKGSVSGFRGSICAFSQGGEPRRRAKPFNQPRRSLPLGFCGFKGQIFGFGIGIFSPFHNFCIWR